jgi:hypothetical protein
MSMEAGVVVGIDGEAIHWHLPSNRSIASLPDSRTLWDVIWENRHRIVGIAHSHPGAGLPGPSYTDVTTFRAIEKALGRKLVWWIVSEDRVVICEWQRRSRSEPGTWVPIEAEQDQPWLEELRRHSYGEWRTDNG